MRVLHVDLGREMRGGQHQVAQLMEELRERGVEQRFLSPFGEPFTIGALRCKCDIVHVHDARSHTWAAIAAKAPLIVSRRVAFPVKTGWLSRWKYSRPTLYLAVSRYVAGKLMEAGVDSNRIEVVYDGVREMAPSTRTGPLIALKTKDPMKGADLIRASGVPVEFVDDLPAALGTARGLLYVTREEGLGSAALLAMSAGVPVIASRIGGLPEIVEHEVTGLLVENDPPRIAEAAGRILAGEGSAWGEQGREVVRARFLARHMADATLAAYRRVVR